VSCFCGRLSILGRLLALVLILISTQAVPRAHGAGKNKNNFSQRKISHDKAYKKRATKEPHISIKVTPPEKRGKKGHVLLEVYNYSKENLSVMTFEVSLLNKWGDVINSEIQVQDLNGGWSDVVWVKIPGKRKIEKITGLRVQNMQMFDKSGKKVQMKHFFDLIKK
jgi:hypothetical protein